MRCGEGRDGEQTGAWGPRRQSDCPSSGLEALLRLSLGRGFQRETRPASTWKSVTGESETPTGICLIVRNKPKPNKENFNRYEQNLKKKGTNPGNT